MAEAAEVLRTGQSLADLRTRHLELLKSWTALTDAGTALEPAMTLRADASRLGATLADPGERDAAQSIIDYWTATIAALPGQAFPDLLRLEPVDETRAAAIVNRANEGYRSLPSADLREAGKAILVELATGRAVEESRLPKPQVALRSAARDRLLAAGVLEQRPEGLAIADAAVVTARWGELGDWIIEGNIEESSVQLLIRRAKRWNDGGRKADLLLSGSVLRESFNRRGRDAVSDEYVSASVVHQWVVRGRTLAMVLAVGLLVWGASWLSNEVTNQQQRGEGETPKTASAPSPDPSVPSSAPIEGFIWVGNGDHPLVRPMGAAPTSPFNPRDIHPDALYVVQSNVALRSDYPDEATYTSADRIGVMAGGATVRALGPAQPFARPLGAQYWLHVRQVANVYIRYSGGGEAAGLAVLTNGLSSDFYLPAPQVLTVPENRIEIHFFSADDVQFAQLAANRLARYVESPRGVTLECSQVSSGQPVSGTIEVSIDLAHIRVAEPAAAPTAQGLPGPKCTLAPLPAAPAPAPTPGGAPVTQPPAPPGTRSAANH